MINILSYAKLNLTLDILDKRPDGYHNIHTIFQTISLHDTITLDEISSGIEIICGYPGVPVDNMNLAWKAAEEVVNRYGQHGGLQIKIEKRIPPGAGLAGGSSNAAAVVIGLNRLWNLNLSTEEMINICSNLGSDAAFFIHGGTCEGSGRGEILNKLKPITETWFGIVMPEHPVSTAWAYSELERLQPVIKNGEYTQNFIDKFPGDPNDLAYLLGNDLETPVIAHYPEIVKAKSLFIEYGALGSLMTGSGSVVFGVALDEYDANHITRQMDFDFPWTNISKSIDSGNVVVE